MAVSVCDKKVSYSLRSLDQRLVAAKLDRGTSEDPTAMNVRHSGQARLRRRKRVKQGVCGVNVPLRTPKRSKRENVQWKRKSAIEEKTVEIYSKEKAFSPTSVVIKTNPLFRTSGTPQRLPTNFKGELQLNVHQQSYIAKTKEEEMVNAIIELAKHGEKKYGKAVKRKSLFHKAKSAIARRQRSKSVERSTRTRNVASSRQSSTPYGTPFRSRRSSECLY